MRTLLLFTCAWFMTERAHGAAEPVNPDPAGIFDFSDLDVPKEDEKGKEPSSPHPADDPRNVLPESVRTILDKLERFSSFKRTALMKEIAAARKVAAEILVKNATATDASTRAALLNEAKRVESLPPERPLTEAAGSSPASSAALAVGSWKKTDKDWINTLAADGTLAHSPSGITGHWRWIDEKRGVLVCDYTPKHPHADLLQIDLKSKAPRAAGLTDHDVVFPLVKIDPAPRPVEKKAVPGDPVTKLAAHETAARKETETLIQSKNTKVAAWLLKQAPSLPAPQARVIVERAAELEGKVSSGDASPNSNSALVADKVRFGGVWSWTGKKLEFADGGIIKVNKAGAGKWTWAKSNSKSLIAFVLEAGDVAALARPSKSKEGVLHISTMKGKPVEVRRE